jgi:hypothetical protein
LSATRTTAASRTSASIALGAFAVHQLRYLAGYGGGAHTALSAQGHAYLRLLLPMLVVLAGSSLLGTVAAGALSAPRAAHRRSAGWAFCTVALLVVFGLQETLEGVFAAGHPGGPAAAFGDGGWIAVPIAIAVGGLVSLLLSALTLAERTLAGSRPRGVPRAPAKLGRPRLPEAPSLACAPMAFGLARRPPPIFST